MNKAEIDIGKLIEYWLHNSKRNKASLARDMRVSKTRISQLSKGINTRSDILVGLADAFGVSPSEFIRPAETGYRNIDGHMFWDYHQKPDTKKLYF